MVKFCLECGTKLDKEYKYCPNCGFDLSKVNIHKNTTDSISETNNSKQLVEVIICDNCGEENDPSAELCSGCGIKLSGKKETREFNSLSDDAEVKPTPKKTSGKKNQKVAQKKLNTVKLLTITGIGLVIAFVILMFSGILNSAIAPGANNTVTQQNGSSGVNLSNIQRINSLENHLKKNPKDTAAILELAHMKNDAGMYQQAIINYKEYLAFVPKDPDARIDMGVCYYNLQDYNTAIKEMEQAVKYDPKHQIGYLNLGIVNLTAGHFEKSKEWLKKAVQLDPNSEYGKKAEELLKSHSNTNQMNGGK